MNEEKRLEELRDYKILDTEPEEALNDISRIASLICETPISLITMVDDKRQWFKAKTGLYQNETPREEAFCQHALSTPEEVLVVEDSWLDKRFAENPLVTGDPHIRFYAGAPLTTPNGNVLGTLCVIDKKPRPLKDNQKQALQFLAAKAMEYLNTRKMLLLQNEELQMNAARLKKLTDRTPGAIFQSRMTAGGENVFDFISEGIVEIHPDLDFEFIKNNPRAVFENTHPDDLEFVRDSIEKSHHEGTDWYAEYRVINKDKVIRWHQGKARVEKEENGETIWYGSIQDISVHREYETTLEQMASDISHVLRRPVATMLGLVNIFNDFDNEVPNEVYEVINMIKVVSEELDNYTRKLDEAYQHKIRKIDLRKIEK